MRVSFNWLKELVDIPWTPEVAAEKLAQLGFPVEKMLATGIQTPNVISVKILNVSRHPNADRLQIAQVTDGKGERTIVCGAPNIAAGQVVPLAIPGAKLPGGIEITVSKIRGVESQGMLCSARELGLSEEHAGIHLLPDSSKLGIPVKDLLGGADALLDIEITPNRPDLMSHVGIARELAALAQKPLKLPRLSTKKAAGKAKFKISIKEPKLCLRYLGKHFQGIKVGPSPDWMVQRLNACGIRAINNIVDITNYVLLEWGHPLHAFDLAKLKGPEIIVRKAQANEKMLALDGKTYSLNPTDCVIADASQAVAIAGVMGGQDTGVTESTTDIILESAVFDRSTVRQTSKRLALRSESSIRFEKGTDAETAAIASLRAAQLIMELAGGNPVSALDAHPSKEKPKTVALRRDRLNALTGLSLKPEPVANILKRLDLKPVKSGSSWKCTVPAYRKDILEEADLVEEVLRMVGYENVPSAGTNASLSQGTIPHVAADETPVGNLLKGLGVTQTLTSSFCSMPWIKRFSINADNLISLMNPVSKEETHMRPLLSLNLLKAAQDNVHHQKNQVALFEIGKTFHKTSSGPVESKHVAMVLYGSTQPLSWQSKEKAVTIYDLKGILESLRSQQGASWELKEGSSQSFLHPNLSFDILYRGSTVGWAGLIHPQLQQELDFTSTCALAEFPWEVLGTKKIGLSKPIARFPFVERDVAVIVGKDVTWSALQKQVKSAGGALVQEITPFDVFTGGNMEAGKKSVAFRVRLQHAEHTLTDAEISGAMDAIRSALQKNCGATLR